jgi:glycosyltransferase involved in cell wall biosynthesis
MNAVTHLMAFADEPERGLLSGAENHLLTLMQAQRRAGWDVELLPLVYRPGPRLSALAQQLRENGIGVVPVEMASAGKIRRILQTVRGIGALRALLSGRRARIIHTHLDHADILGKLAARLAGCPHVVSTVHNNEPYYGQLRWRLLLRRLDRYTRHYIAISEAVRKQLLQVATVPVQKVQTIYYGVAPPQNVLTPAALRRRFDLPLDRFVVGFVGRLVRQKNLPLLLGAAERLPHVHVVVVGSGDQEAELRRRAPANVQFLGHQPEGATLMPAFDLFCLPSRWEGLGLVLVEAMLQRVAVAGSRAGAIPEILGYGAYGELFSPDSVAADRRHRPRRRASRDPGGAAQRCLRPCAAHLRHRADGGANTQRLSARPAHGRREKRCLRPHRAT